MKQIDDLLSEWEHHKEKGESISAEVLCRDHPELLEEVRRNIRVLEEVDLKLGIDQTRFRESSQGAASRTRGQSNAAILNQEFQITNRYQIERHHASGGLGDVYVAIDPILNRKVAIKFPRKARLTSEQIARFEREARITGQLDHPGIVAVHSLKMSDDSHPCYVMRFVHGPTLQERAKEFHQSNEANQSNQRFSSSAFRELMQHFVTLCNIVGYAHEQGVIHRDIKPSNVILGPFGQTYLMDWGLARADCVDSLDPSLDDLSDIESEPVVDEQLNRSAIKGTASTKPPFSTKTGQVMGTPAFASPEQLLGRSDQVDQRSDVYSLGASLYFVITGKLPVETSDSAEYFERLNAEKESLLKFSASIPAPLAAICRAATHIDSTLRYPNASALAADLQRHLAGESVEVHRESWLVRSQRWLRKHPRTAVGTAVSFGLLTLFAVVASALTTGFNRQLGAVNADLTRSNASLEQASKDADAARIRAEANLATARGAVDEYLVKVTDDARLKSEDFSKLQSELLESARPFYEALLQQQPGDANVEFARAEAYRRLARIDRRANKNDTARAGYQKAIDILSPLLAVYHDPDEIRFAMASCRDDYGIFLADFDRQESLKQHRTALADCEPLVSRSSPQTKHLHLAASIHTNLASLLANELDETEAAMEEVSQGISILRKLIEGGATDPEFRGDLAFSYIVRGTRYKELSRLEEADKDYQSGLVLIKALVEEVDDEPDYRATLGLLHQVSGGLKIIQGDLQSALAEYRSATSVLTTLVDRFPSISSFHSRLAGTWMGMGNVQLMLSEYDNAIDSYASALEIVRLLLRRTPDSTFLRSSLAGGLSNLGVAYQESGDRAKAAQCYLEAISIQRKFLEASPENASHLNTLALAVGNYGEFVLAESPIDAIPLFDEAYDLIQKVLKVHPQHPAASLFSSRIQGNKGRALFELARYQESIDLYQKAMTGMHGNEQHIKDVQATIETFASVSRNLLKRVPKLDSMIAGKDEPADEQERLELARHCYRRQLFLRSAGELKVYIEKVPKHTVENLQMAAQAAALAAAGKGDDSSKLNETDRVQWRDQCRQWLEQLVDETLKSQEGAQQGDAPRQARFTLKSILSRRDFASVRDPDALSKLADSERGSWEVFWTKVRERATED